jgi:hypothetical protein
MKRHKRISERGIALIVVLFALILVTAIGLGLMFSTNGETGVSFGYRNSNLSYFGARSGAEELRDRIRIPNTSNANGLLNLPRFRSELLRSLHRTLECSTLLIPEVPKLWLRGTLQISTLMTSFATKLRARRFRAVREVPASPARPFPPSQDGTCKSRQWLCQVGRH